MKRYVLILVVFLVAFSAWTQESYDSEVTVRIMRQFAGSLGRLQSAIADKDFLAASGAFAVMAQGSLTLLDYNPPQGEKAEWDRMHRQLVNAALDGVLAASESDSEGVAAALSTIRRLNGQGHGTFRSSS